MLADLVPRRLDDLIKRLRAKVPMNTGTTHSRPTRSVSDAFLGGEDVALTNPTDWSSWVR